MPMLDSAHPAAFVNWARSRSGKLRHDGRPAWQPLAERADAPRVAVLIHVFYPDLLPEIAERAAAIPVPFDVVITNASAEPLPPLDFGERARDVRVLEVHNRGRDILPLVSVANADLLEPYDLVLKVHTKKSAWRAEHRELAGSGEEWRERFLDQLLGSSKQIETILAAFAEDPALGILTADDCIVGREHWGSNREMTAELLLRLELRERASLRFASGSMYWARGFLLSGLTALDLRDEDFEDEAGQIDGTVAHAVERLLGILCEEAGFVLRERGQLRQAEEPSAWRQYLPTSPRVPEARVCPFYLPQFHAFPENDAWWGKGFTEWSNVASAKPLFLGHVQPKLPGDLGFYDLRDPSVRPRQYALAREAGIEGFMYYYYWFEGKKLMDLPVEQLVQSEDDHPFCLMWANENWTRRWDGWDEDILIAQNYDNVPATRFIDDVSHLLTDPRYMRVDGKPVLAVYRITQIPDHEAVLEHWRRRAEELGLPGLTLLVVDVSTQFQGLPGDVREAGLDGVLEFPPHNRRWVHPNGGIYEVDSGFSGAFLRYDSLAEHAEQQALEGLEEHRFPGVMVCFDNTARRQSKSHVYYGANPYTFRRWLRTAVLAVQDRPADERLVFVNAWNEWAEGAVLEPTQRFGRSYLQAVRSAVIAA